MASVALGQRTQVVARVSNDRALLRGFLERDRLLAAYAICDLDDREFGRTKWGDRHDRRAPRGRRRRVLGSHTQPMFLMGRNDGVAAILRDVLRPRAAYVAALLPIVPTVAQLYAWSPARR